MSSSSKAKEVQVKVEIVKLNSGTQPIPEIEDVQLEANATEIDLTNLRATSLPDLHSLTQLQRLTFRQNWLTSFDYERAGCKHLIELDLFENKIADLTQCRFPPDLVVLDLSHNEIKKITDLSYLTHLRELFLVENRIKHIQNLDGLGERLRSLELGSNSLRKIEGLEKLVILEELWLGRNKIEKIEGIENLTKLKKMSVQSNRLVEIGDGLRNNTQLRELYLSHNGITSALGLSQLVQLTTLDLSGNRLTTLLGVGLESLIRLEEFWLNTNQFSEWEQIEPVLRALAGSLQTIYLEENPVQKIQSQEEYTKKVKSIVPKLLQLDANIF